MSLSTRGRLIAAALLLVTSWLPFPRGSFAATKPQFAPCSLLHREDVTRLTAWHVDSVRRKRYDFNGATGAMCFFESTQGTVIVIVPDRGSPFPGDSPFADPQDEGVVRRDRATGVQVTYYNGTAYMTVLRRDVAVRVVPNSHIASYFEVEPFAETIIRRIEN